MVTDLTTGDPFRVIWRFSLPMILSMIFQQMYQLADGMIAGRYIGMDALGAVGASHSITTLFLAAATGSAIGVSVVVSQQFGAKDLKQVHHAVSTAVRTLMAFAAILTLVDYPLSGALLQLLGTPDELMEFSRLYLQIYVLGIPFLFLYNLANGIFNALGDSKTPLYFLILSSVLNVILDILLVVQFDLDIFGIAFATWLARGIAGVAAICLVLRRVRALCPPVEKKFDKALCYEMMRIGIPTIIQQSCTGLGQMSVQSVINGYGHAVVAGYSAAFKINTLVMMSMNSLSSAVSSYVAQNLGAKDLARIRQGIRVGLKLMLTMGILVVVTLLAGGSFWIQVFLEEGVNEMAIQAGTGFLYIVSPAYLLVAFKFVSDATLRGIGAMKEFMVANFADLFMRIIFSIVMSHFFGYLGIWWVWPMAWLVGTSLSMGFCFKKMRFLQKNL